MSFNVEAEVAVAIQAFRFNEATYLEILHGPVARDLVKRGIRVESSAKEHASGRPGPNVRTGRLRDSITWRLGQDEQSVYVDVGSAVLYAPYLEVGTSRMPAYPYLRPALEAARATF
jgi:HK97 gp10 family phage protein